MHASYNVNVHVRVKVCLNGLACTVALKNPMRLDTTALYMRLHERSPFHHAAVL